MLKELGSVCGVVLILRNNSKLVGNVVVSHGRISRSLGVRSGFHILIWILGMRHYISMLKELELGILRYINFYTGERHTVLKKIKNIIALYIFFLIIIDHII